MSNDTKAMVDAVQASVTNLLELVELAGRGRHADEVGELKQEAQRTVLKMIAAIVMADQKYAEGEKAFVNLLVDWEKRRDGDVRYLTEHAEEWKRSFRLVPRFFEAAAEHDTRLHTDVARGMIREMQLIGDMACISDGHYEVTEHAVVRGYTDLLLEYLERRKRERSSAGAAVEGWTNV